jgi:AcrR family transcriptional regulator
VTAPVRVDPRVARTREAVLSAAADLLAELGWGRVTVEAVSARSGVARTTIYRHWPDLHHLLAEALESAMDPCLDPDTGSLRGDLEVIVSGLARTLTQSSAAGVLTSMIDAAERDPDIAELQRTFAQQRRQALRRALERAVERGEVDGRCDLPLESSLIAGPLFYRRMVSREPITADVVAQVVDTACRRLRPTPNR